MPRFLFRTTPRMQLPQNTLRVSTIACQALSSAQ